MSSEDSPPTFFIPQYSLLILMFPPLDMGISHYALTDLLHPLCKTSRTTYCSANPQNNAANYSQSPLLPTGCGCLQITWLYVDACQFHLLQSQLHSPAFLPMSSTNCLSHHPEQTFQTFEHSSQENSVNINSMRKRPYQPFHRYMTK